MESGIESMLTSTTGGRGACRPGCAACVLEARAYGTAEAADGDQPAEEVLRQDGDQAGLVPPERRFEVVVVDHT